MGIVDYYILHPTSINAMEIEFRDSDKHYVFWDSDEDEIEKRGHTDETIENDVERSEEELQQIWQTLEKLVIHSQQFDEATTCGKHINIYMQLHVDWDTHQVSVFNK